MVLTICTTKLFGYPLYIQHLNGYTSKIEITDTDKIKDLKAKVFQETGIPTEHQRFRWNYKNISDDDEQYLGTVQTVSVMEKAIDNSKGLGIPPESTIHLILKLSGD